MVSAVNPCARRARASLAQLVGLGCVGAVRAGSQRYVGPADARSRAGQSRSPSSRRRQSRPSGPGPAKKTGPRTCRAPAVTAPGAPRRGGSTCPAGSSTRTAATPAPRARPRARPTPGPSPRLRRPRPGGGSLGGRRPRPARAAGHRQVSVEVDKAGQGQLATPVDPGGAGVGGEQLGGRADRRDRTVHDEDRGVGEDR